MKKKKGFTLVELVIVIAVIAVLAAVLVPTFITVINSANDSADTQLVANMNTALSTEIYADQTATSENLRKLLKDFGYDAEDLATKNSNNVIVYNKTTKRFEKLNYKDADLTVKSYSAAASVKRTSLVAHAKENLVIDPSPLSPEEIFDNYIITSTAGNDLAEALFALHNFDSKAAAENNAVVINKLLNNNKIAETIKTVIKPILSTTLYVAKNGEMFGLDLTDGFAAIDSPPSDIFRIVFHEEYTTLDAQKLANAISGKSTTVVLPYTLESIENLELCASSFWQDHSYCGNIGLFENIEEQYINKSQISNKSYSEIKELVAGPERDKNLQIAGRGAFFFGEGTNLKGSEEESWCYPDIQQALDIAAQSALYTGNSRKVVQTDKTYTIDKNVTVPANVILCVPYLYSQTMKTPSDQETTASNYENGYFLGVGTTRYETKEGGLFYASAQPGHYPLSGAGANSVDFDTKVNNFKPSLVDDNLKTETNYQYKSAADTFKQFELIINKNRTLTVANDGALVVGGVINIGYQNNTYRYQGHVAGYYAEIQNNGDIKVEDGGLLNVYGYVKGEGNINVEKGGELSEPLVITDLPTANGELNDLTSMKSSFLRYALPNIQSKLTVHYGATIYMTAGMSKLLVDGIFIGYKSDEGDKTEGLITLETEESYIVTEYKKESMIYDNNATNGLAGDIGINRVNIYGTAQTGTFTLTDAMLNVFLSRLISQALFPIPYNFEYEINGTFNVYNRFAVLPGAKVTVNEGGMLNVTKGSEFEISDYMYQGATLDSRKYPTAEQLSADGINLPTSGLFTLNGGTFKVEDNAIVGGVIRAKGAGAKIQIGANVNTSGNFIVGSITRKTTNASVYESPLRVVTGDNAFTVLAAGDSYTSTSTQATATQDIEMAYLALGTETIEIDEKIEKNSDNEFVKFFDNYMTEALKNVYGSETFKQTYAKYEWYKKTQSVTVTTNIFEKNAA